jgi:hypothetical protein
MRPQHEKDNGSRHVGVFAASYLSWVMTCAPTDRSDAHNQHASPSGHSRGDDASLASPGTPSARRRKEPPELPVGPGRPAETIEVDPTTIDPLHIAEMTPADRDVLMSQIVEMHPRLAALMPERLRAVPEE